MATHETLTRANLKTPKAAAVAGILFSILSIIVFALLRISVPADPYESGSWLRTNSSTVIVALNLVPFAGIAFRQYRPRHTPARVLFQGRHARAVAHCPCRFVEGRCRLRLGSAST